MSRLRERLKAKREAADRPEPHDLMDVYLSDPGLGHRILSREEERELGYRIQQGDREARDTLVEHNLRLAIGFAKREYAKLGRREKQRVDFIDIVQQANTAIIVAAEKYDPDRNTKFATYASYWARKMIHDFCKHPRDLSLFPEAGAEGPEFEGDPGLVDLVDHLSDRERLAVKLNHGIGMTRRYPVREVAVLMGVSTSTATHLLRDAYAYLRKEAQTRRINVA